MIGIRKFDNGIETQLTLCLSGDMSAADVRETLHYAARSTLENRMCGIEGCARQILLDAGHDPERPGYFEAPPEHSRIALAHEILRRIGIFRCAASKGDHNEAACQAVRREVVGPPFLTIRQIQQHNLAKSANPKLSSAVFFGQ